MKSQKPSWMYLKRNRLQELHQRHEEDRKLRIKKRAELEAKLFGYDRSGKITWSLIKEATLESIMFMGAPASVLGVALCQYTYNKPTAHTVLIWAIIGYILTWLLALVLVRWRKMMRGY